MRSPPRSRGVQGPRPRLLVSAAAAAAAGRRRQVGGEKRVRLVAQRLAQQSQVCVVQHGRVPLGAHLYEQVPAVISKRRRETMSISRGTSTSLLVRPRFTLLYCTYLHEFDLGARPSPRLLVLGQTGGGGPEGRWGGWARWAGGDGSTVGRRARRRGRLPRPRLPLGVGVACHPDGRCRVGRIESCSRRQPLRRKPEDPAAEGSGKVQGRFREGSGKGTAALAPQVGRPGCRRGAPPSYVGIRRDTM